MKTVGMMKYLPLTSYLLARITVTLISFFAITGCFKKVNLKIRPLNPWGQNLTAGFNLVILNFELPLTFLYVLRELFEKWTVEIIMF